MIRAISKVEQFLMFVSGPVGVECGGVFARVLEISLSEG